jgi:hypothetical protein
MGYAVVHSAARLGVEPYPPSVVGQGISRAPLWCFRSTAANQRRQMGLTPIARANGRWLAAEVAPPRCRLQCVE